MTIENLTALLVEQVMGWTVSPDRFLVGDRRWMPSWRFQPAEKLLDAFRLLEEAAPQEYTMRGDSTGNFRVEIRIGDATGEASGTCKPRAITWAVARALGIEVEP